MNPLLLTAIFGFGKDIINKVFPDPADAVKAEQALRELDLQDQAQKLSAILAEAQSTDPWTSRARPAFLYVFYIILAVMAMVAPMIGLVFPDKMDQFFINVTKGFHAIPEEVWWTFTTGYLGYSGMRTVEKVKKVG